MNKYIVAKNIENVLTNKVRVPTTVMWNRLEGRPRKKDFSRALQAEVRDPLWMITRQWQMGEFVGEDAGSPVTAKVAWTTDEISELHFPGGKVVPYSDELPLEAVIEARDLTLDLNEKKHNIDLRLMLGQRWKKLLESQGLGSRVADYLAAYPFEVPDPSVESDNPITAHPGSWQVHQAIAARAIDGGELLLHLIKGGTKASDGLGLVDPEKSQVDLLGEDFRKWGASLYMQSEEIPDAWNARHLEYSVDLSAPDSEKPAALSAPEYRGGRLDWFNFDAIDPGQGHASGSVAPVNVTSFMPTTIQFDGMPNTRHWSFEDGVINFGDIEPDTTDISKLLLIEFGLVFANDWFLLPIELPVGSLTKVKGLTVTNVFGERYWIEPAVSEAGPELSWKMFQLTNKGAADDRLFLPATTPSGLESAPVESVSFIRDEVSNMVWGIETLVQLHDGASRRGREVAQELHGKYQGAVAVPASSSQASDAKIKYTLMNTVAEHWIPFIPVHIDNDNHEIQLQRAAMPRLLEGESGVVPDKVAPRTRLLRNGLDDVPPASYFVAEEEVVRAGTVIESKWQRCRWLNGRVVVWHGFQRKTGRGEGSSGLAFDIIEPNVD